MLNRTRHILDAEAASDIPRLRTDALESVRRLVQSNDTEFGPVLSGRPNDIDDAATRIWKSLEALEITDTRIGNAEHLDAIKRAAGSLRVHLKSTLSPRVMRALVDAAGDTEAFLDYADHNTVAMDEAEAGLEVHATSAPLAMDHDTEQAKDKPRATRVTRHPGTHSEDEIRVIRGTARTKAKETQASVVDVRGEPVGDPHRGSPSGAETTPTVEVDPQTPAKTPNDAGRTTTDTRTTPIDPGLDAKACAAYVAHPEWSGQKIADSIGCYRTHLYRLKRFSTLKKLIKTGSPASLSGVKVTDDQGNQKSEAWHSSDIRSCPHCREDHTFKCPTCELDDLACPVCHIETHHSP